MTAFGYSIQFLVPIKARLLSSGSQSTFAWLLAPMKKSSCLSSFHIALKIAMIFRYFDACAFSDSEVFHLSSSQDSYFYFKIAVFSSTLLPHLHIYAMPNHNAKFSTQPVHKYVMFQVDNDEFPFGFRYLLPSKYLTDYCRKIQAIHISVCILYAS